MSPRCSFSIFETFQTIISTTSTLTSSQAQQQTSNMGAPSNGSKTAHSKVANGTNAGTSGNTTNQTTTSKRSSSSADGDYQLVQHEVLYSQSSQYEVSFAYFSFFHININAHTLFLRLLSSCSITFARAGSLKIKIL